MGKQRMHSEPCGYTYVTNNQTKQAHETTCGGEYQKEKQVSQKKKGMA